MGIVYRNADRELEAQAASDYLYELLSIETVPTTAVVLGTGWGDKLPLEIKSRVKFEDVPGFSGIGTLEGHSREFIYGECGGKPVLVQKGRLHLNEDPGNSNLYKMVRLQTEALLQLGVTDLIVTNAAGLLPGVEQIEVGDVVVIDSFVTLFAPQMPLWAGEFCSPEDALNSTLLEKASLSSGPLDGRLYQGGYAMLLGPWFEGRKLDKQILANSGAKLVGMSTLPEACIAALYPGTKMLGLSFVSNDAVAAHSHEQNLRKAQEKSQVLGGFLSELISKI